MYYYSIYATYVYFMSEINTFKYSIVMYVYFI